MIVSRIGSDRMVYGLPYPATIRVALAKSSQRILIQHELSNGDIAESMSIPAINGRRLSQAILEATRLLETQSPAQVQRTHTDGIAIGAASPSREPDGNHIIRTAASGRRRFGWPLRRR